jgi:hypothetical protein
MTTSNKYTNTIAVEPELPKLPPFNTTKEVKDFVGICKLIAVINDLRVSDAIEFKQICNHYKVLLN